MTGRKAVQDFTRCRICGARIHWTPRDTRQHRGPLDPGQPVYLDLDAEPVTVAYECATGLAIHGAVVADLAAPEQRAADERRTPAAGDGVRRIVRCYRVHVCEPDGGWRMAGGGSQQRRPSAVGHQLSGTDRAAGAHMEE